MGEVTWEGLDERVDLYFGVENRDLRLVGQQLARSGFEWADIRHLMSRVWGVAWHEGYSEGYEDRGMEEFYSD